MELCSPCGEVPWSIVAVSRRVLASSRVTTRTVSVLNALGFSHAREAVYGISNCKFLILNKDAIGFPSWWTTSPPLDLLDTPTQVCLSRLQHSAPSIAFFSRMGASTRGIALGSPHSSVRLHTSVWPQSPLFRRGSPDSSKQRLKGFCATAGAVLPPPQGGNRGGPSIGPGTRLFQSLFSCAKEGRRSTTYSRPASSEPLPLQREVQDVDVEDYYVSDSSGRLVCHCRPERCPFYSGRSVAQEVPSVRFWREGLPIQGSSLWPGFGSEDVHKVHGCCSGPVEAPGHSCTTWTIGSFWPTPGSQ